MTRVVIVGEIYNADLQIGGGPMPGRPPGIWGGPPLYPDQGLPGAPPGYWGGVAPPHPDQGLPGSQPQPSHPIAPGGQPPGYWGGVAPPYPDQGLPGGQGGVPTHPIHIPGVPDQGLPEGTPIPPDQVGPPALPPGHEDDLVIAVKSPGGEWQYTSYDVAPDQGQPAPTPYRRR
jgi:hypothetical protein